MTTGESEHPLLSEAGIRRREDMLTMMVGQVRARRRRRRAATAAAVIGPVAVCFAWLGWNAMRPPATPTPFAAGSSVGPEVSPPPLVQADRKPETIKVEFIRTDPLAGDRLRVAEGPARFEPIGDSQLIDVLVESGRSPGLIRVGTRVTVVNQKPAPDEVEPPGRSEGLLDPRAPGHATAGAGAL